MKFFLKRLGAYFIDIIIVSLISFVISNSGLFSSQIETTKKAYEEYEEVYKNFKDEKITEKEYNKKVDKLRYKIDKNSVNTVIISMACLVAYFGIFQFSQNGQTIGKRVFKLQTVKYKDGNLNIGNYLLRSLILNNILFSIANIVCVQTLNQKNYINYLDIMSKVQTIYQILLIISILMSKEGRGIHDLISGTRVIDLKEENEFQSGVIEGEVIK